MFYYGKDEYEAFLKFFDFLGGKRSFDSYQFQEAFDAYSRLLKDSGASIPSFALSHSIFLQFLYDLNIICYKEYPESDRTYVHWCFRERTYGNISPKVKEDSDYEIFYGLEKALNVGRKTISRRRIDSVNDDIRKLV